jgi:hypothetical protein
VPVLEKNIKEIPKQLFSLYSIIWLALGIKIDRTIHSLSLINQSIFFISEENIYEKKYKEEFTMPRTGQSPITANNQYIANGITISPAVPTAGESIRVIYDGLLAAKGASDILAHVGFGDKWENVFDYRMVKTVGGFEATVQIANNANNLKVCFKDCANNWDNNSGMNYSFNVTQ